MNRSRRPLATHYLLLATFFVWTLFQSVLIAPNPTAALYFWLKLLELSLLFLYLRPLIPNSLFLIRSALGTSVLFQSIIASGQWIKQGNLFPYWLLGESPYSAATASIDKISWFGALKIPPLGTTPHPNVLGGFLAVSLVILWITQSKKTRSHCIISLFGFITLILTQSLSAVFSLGLAVLLIAANTRPSIRKTLLLVASAILAALLIRPTLEPTSLSRRVKLNDIALKIIATHLLGVGLNNFTAVMPQYGEIEATYRFLQPVHNIYLLLWSESGLIGFVIVVLFVSKLKIVYPVAKLYGGKLENWKIPALMVLTIGLVDHYSLTLQTGQLLTILSITLIHSKPSLHHS